MNEQNLILKFHQRVSQDIIHVVTQKQVSKESISIGYAVVMSVNN